MKSVPTTDTTHVLGESQGYQPLYVHVGTMNVEGKGEMPIMRSTWTLNGAEIVALMGGAQLILTVLGSTMPPVMIETGEIPCPPKD